MRNFFCVCLILFAFKSYSQQPVISTVFTATQSFRGLSVVNDNIIWVSGNNGTVLKSTDGGQHFKTISVPGFEKSDFRDIEGFDSLHAIVLGTNKPAVLLETRDGGATWKEIFHDDTDGAFLDAMTFNKDNGIVVGDPLNDRKEYKLWIDIDKNETKVSKIESTGQLLQGEAFFASSGTNVTFTSNKSSNYAYVTGGKISGIYFERKSSRLMVRATIQDLPFAKGDSTIGANSISIFGKLNLVVVGGNFAQPADTSNNCFLSFNGGKTWTKPASNPLGYRSCVEHIDKNRLVACGFTGTDISTDGGRTWKLLTNEGFHVVQKAKKGNAIFFAGKGKVAVMQWPDTDN